MALKPCKECKTEVSTSASKCPHCGVDHPTLTSKAQLIGCLSLIAVIGGCWIVASSSGGGDSSSPSIPTLQAQVQRSSTQILVTNRSDHVWRNCEVELNAGIVRGGYSQTVPQIAPGEQVAGGLMAFTRSGGERFNPATHVVESVTVSCDTSAGRAYYFGSF